MFRPCFPPTVPRPGVSFPPQGPRGVGFPCFTRYYETLRLPAALPAALRCPSLGGTTSVRLCLCSRRARRRCWWAWSFRVWQPHGQIFRDGDDRISQVPGEPRLRLCPVLRPRRDRTHPGHLRCIGAAPALGTRRLRQRMTDFRGSIARPWHSLSTLRRPVTPHRRKTRFQLLASSTGRA